MPEKQTNKDLIAELVEAAESVHARLTSHMLEEIQAAEAAWQKLPEQKQQAVIDRIRSKAADVIRQLVQVVAGRGFDSGEAFVDQVVFKDGCKIVLKTQDRGSAHRLADWESKPVTIVFADPGAFMSVEGFPEPDPDQRNLIE